MDKFLAFLELWKLLSPFRTLTYHREQWLGALDIFYYEGLTVPLVYPAGISVFS